MAGSGAAATGGLFRCIYEGVISGCDSEIERRPYHKNCGCALHRGGKGAGCSRSNKNLLINRKISYPMRKSWSEGCLGLLSEGGTTTTIAGGEGASPSSNFSSPSSSSSPSAAAAASASNNNNNNNFFIRRGSSSSKLKKEVNFQIMYEKDEEEEEEEE